MSEKELTIEYDIETIGIRNVTDLKKIMAANYKKTLENYLGNEENALKFMSAMVADVQRNPKLLSCTPPSLFNSYLMMAGCGFMPSAVSGEAYILPYNNSKKVNGEWVQVMEAQFQMGYQGLVTLFYKAGVKKINAQIVRKNDKAEMINGEMRHSVPLGMSKAERGEPIGAYVTITFRGEENTMYMNGEDIINHAKKFSKSFDASGKHSPWNPSNDPELTMWKKTVLKQMSKFLPKNESINIALMEDHKDSKIYDRIEAAKGDAQKLSMGNLELNHGKEENDEGEAGAGRSTGGDQDSQEEGSN